MKPIQIAFASLIVSWPLLAAPQDAPVPKAASDRIEREAVVIDGPDGRKRGYAPMPGSESDAADAGLADSIAQALDNNPEIVTLRAEIQVSLARLEQLKMKIATDITRKQAELNSLIKQHNAATGAGSVARFGLEGEIAQAKADLQYLLGRRQGDGNDERNPIVMIDKDGQRRAIAGIRGPLLMGGEPTPRPTLASLPDSPTKKILESPITLKFDSVPLFKIIEFIKEIYEVNFNIDVNARDAMVSSIELKNAPLKDALAALSDATDVVFIVRDYGIFATRRERAISIPGPSIPEGVPYVEPGKRGPIGRLPIEERRIIRLRDTEDAQAPTDAPHVERKSDGPAPAPAPAPKKD